MARQRPYRQSSISRVTSAPPPRPRRAWPSTRAVDSRPPPSRLVVLGRFGDFVELREASTEFLKEDVADFGGGSKEELAPFVDEVHASVGEGLVEFVVESASTVSSHLGGRWWRVHDEHGSVARWRAVRMAAHRDSCGAHRVGLCQCEAGCWNARLCALSV